MSDSLNVFNNDVFNSEMFKLSSNCDLVCNNVKLENNSVNVPSLFYLSSLSSIKMSAFDVINNDIFRNGFHLSGGSLFSGDNSVVINWNTFRFRINMINLKLLKIFALLLLILMNILIHNIDTYLLFLLYSRHY